MRSAGGRGQQTGLARRGQDGAFKGEKRVVAVDELLQVPHAEVGEVHVGLPPPTRGKGSWTRDLRS